jgi:hypothetical protein
LEEPIQSAISYLMSLAEEELNALLRELGVDSRYLKSFHLKSFHSHPKLSRFKKP